MAIINLIPNDGIAFQDGVKFQITRDTGGEASNATIVLSGGPLVAVCQAAGIQNLSLTTSLPEISKLVRGINIAQQFVSING